MGSLSLLASVLLASVALVVANSVRPSGLRVGFYASSCPSAEVIIKKTLDDAFADDPGLTADFVRMHFHDCFVRGCDASVLLNSANGNTAERDHPVNNPSLEGFDVIDKAKTQLEAACPGIVSCADIIAVAARDSVVQSGGLFYDVPTGRRDGRVSIASDVPNNLPGPELNIQQLVANFAKKGISVDEMVTLSGAHSIGVSHCSSFKSRLYNFNGTNAPDPLLDPAYAAVLRTKCPLSATQDDTVNLDSVTPNQLDNTYYQEVMKLRGLFSTDEALFKSPLTSRMVSTNARFGQLWAQKFVKAMLHMGTLEVLTGTQGEVRKVCSAVN